MTFKKMVDTPTNTATLPHVAELLVNLLGECGETVQAVSKTLQHGPLSCGPGQSNCNLADLERELGHILGVAKMLVDAKYISQAGIDAGIAGKLAKYPLWSHGELAVRDADPELGKRTHGPSYGEHF